jgi:hypothetical protein
MRALPASLSLLVTIVAAAPVRAELPHLVLRLATDAEHDPPVPRDAREPSPRARGVGRARLCVTGAAVAPVPRVDVAALTRVEGLATRALQPRIAVQSPVVRAVKLSPMWPLGAYVTLEYGMRR